jgi:hypothetical protein
MRIRKRSHHTVPYRKILNLVYHKLQKINAVHCLKMIILVLPGEQQLLHQQGCAYAQNTS